MPPFQDPRPRSWGRPASGGAISYAGCPAAGSSGFLLEPPCSLVLFPLLILAGGLAALLDSAKQPENQHPTAGASCSRARTLGKS